MTTRCDHAHTLACAKCPVHRTVFRQTRTKFMNQHFLTSASHRSPTHPHPTQRSTLFVTFIVFVHKPRVNNAGATTNIFARREKTGLKKVHKPENKTCNGGVQESEMCPDNPKWSKMVQNGPKWSKMVNNMNETGEKRLQTPVFCVDVFFRKKWTQTRMPWLFVWSAHKKPDTTIIIIPNVSTRSVELAVSWRMH